ncbi:MAG: hypothetical protein KAH01_01060 [Caldisericia bacterium]|nr:hypothetical protein [Caldisericia bacterium]
MSKISLKNNSGLPIKLDLITGDLTTDDQGEVLYDVSTRTLDAAKDYYINIKGIDLDTNLYKMYRGIRLVNDNSSILSGRIRHDITVVMPGRVNEEYIKTIGHIHPIMKEQTKESKLRYPEIYSVIHGTAYYIIQKYSNDLKSIEDIEAVCVNEGEHIIIPSHYGHVTVNTKSTPLVMANIIENSFASNYKPYKEKRGAALYIKYEAENPIKFEKNENYKNLPTPIICGYKHFKVQELKNDEPLYNQFIENPEKFSYLYKE